MKQQIETLEVLDKLRGLHQHYVRLIGHSNDRGDASKALMYKHKADAVKNSIHEVEILCGAID